MTSDREQVLAQVRQDAQLAQGWTSTVAERAMTCVREAMSETTGLLPVAEAAAVAIGSLMSVWEITITLIDGSEYWDIVDLCDEQEDWPRFPDHRYHLSEFPVGTERMLSGKGYIAGHAADEVLTEFERRWPEVPAGSIMSVPIIALGGVYGEIFLVRDHETPPFTRDDLDFSSELATLFGARLPALVATYAESRGEQQGAESLPTLTRRLRAHLD